MGDFLGSMYCLFEDVFGLELAEYMWGNVDNCPQTSNLFIGIGLWLLAISLAVAVVFYYVINRPSWGNIWVWLIVCGVNAGLNFLMGLYWTSSELYAGNMVRLNPENNVEEALNIGYGNCTLFGLSNALLSVVWFFAISMCIKWWSHASNAPFSWYAKK